MTHPLLGRESESHIRDQFLSSEAPEFLAFMAETAWRKHF